MPSILITGCSSGIGYETAKMLRQMGWQVFASCRRAEDAERLRREGFAYALQLDVDDSGSIQTALDGILSQTGGTLDAFFSNAGYGQVGAVEDVPRQALREQFETNVFGAWECLNAAMPWRGAYNSSKFALEGMCDTLRHELHGTDIHVSLVEPGPIATRFRDNALIKFRQHIDYENSVHVESYRCQLNRLQAEGAAVPFTLSAQECAAVCIRALADRRPKVRYLVTVPTVAFWYLKRILPTRWLDALQRASVKGQGKK